MDDIEQKSPSPEKKWAADEIREAEILLKDFKEEFPKGQSESNLRYFAEGKMPLHSKIYPQNIIDCAIHFLHKYSNISAKSIVARLAAKNMGGEANLAKGLADINHEIIQDKTPPVSINTHFSPVPPRSERGRARLLPKVHDRISGKDRAAGLDRDDDKGKIVDGVFVRDIQ